MKKNPNIRFKDVKRVSKIKTATKILFATIAIALTVGCYNVDFSNVNKTDVATGMTVAALPLFMVAGQFKELEGAELTTFKDEATPEQLGEYYEALNKHNRSKLEALIKANASKEDIDKLLESLKSNVPSDYAELKKEHIELMAQVKALSEKGLGPEKVKGLKQYILENSEVLKNLKSSLKKNEKGNLKHVAFSVEKGTQGASDIGSRDFLGTIEAGIEKQPIQRTAILDLFRRKPVGTEYLHFWEENVVTRDAKFVVACATSTHNTKKTWQKRTVELAKIRDIVDICIDMLDDYAFVESEIKELVNESIQLKADYELLLGASALSTDMLSINSISSEFNHANPLAVYTSKFKMPTLGDLTAAMKAQIYTFGKERAWVADTVVMNYNDMITFLHAKDSNNNYIFPNFVFGATDVINGMRIVTSPIVSANTLYVFDSTKGSILDRKTLTVNSYFENNDNAEHELVTFVGVERLQFHVRNINRDAFMKCSDINVALGNITGV